MTFVTFGYIISLFACLYWLQNREFRYIRHRYSVLAGLFWLQRRGWHFVASGTVILFLHVFSDYTGGDDISLHPAPLPSACMSVLITKEGMTFRCIRHRYSLLACLFWLRRRGWHFVASGTVILFLHVFSDFKGGDDISLHPAPLFSSCMSFLTIQEGMTFCCLCEKNWSCWLLGTGITDVLRHYFTTRILFREYFCIPYDVLHDVYCPPCRFNLTQEVNLRGETF